MRDGVLVSDGRGGSTSYASRSSSLFASNEGGEGEVGAEKDEREWGGKWKGGGMVGGR